MRLRTTHALIPISLALAFTATSAEAQSRRNAGDIELAVSIVDGCNLSTTDVVFGLVIGTAGTIRATGAVDVQCTADLDFVIRMDRGVNNLGLNRRMANPTSGAFMRYELYSDPAFSQRWTDKRNGEVAGNSGATGYATFPVYGELTFDGTAVSGRYEDTVTVTIEF